MKALKPLLPATLAWLSLLLLIGCSTPVGPVIPLEAVSLDKTAVAVFSGETEPLGVTFDPADATEQGVVWTTGDSDVALVSATGLVTAVSAGTTTITVTAVDGAWAASSVVMVVDPQATRAAADRLVETQNSDGGWEWEDPDTDPLTGTPSPYNTLGVTAQGLVDAHRATGSVEYQTAGELTYLALLANAENPTPTYHKIRGSDLSFLVGLSETTGDPAYAEFAKARYEATLTEFGGGTATGLAQYVRAGRLTQQALIAWDINLFVRGAIALDRYYPGEGFDADAGAMAEVIYTAMYVSPVDFDVAVQTQDWYWLSITGAVESFALTGLHGTELGTLTTALLGSQQPDGYLGDPLTNGLVQTTAYAVMALVEAGEAVAAMNGVSYLMVAQGANGGWQEDGGENTERDSEALHAIYACLERF